MFYLSSWLTDQIQFLLHPFGILIFIFVYILWVIFLLPSSWLTMFAGFIYGTLQGSILVFISAFFGAIITFLSCRSFLTNWAQRRLSNYPKLKYVEEKVSQEGLRLIILTRLSPIFPFGLLNLMFGLSDVKFKNFVIGLIAILPGTILYCSLGALAGEITQFNQILSNKNDLLSFLFTFVGFIATFGVVFLVYRTSKQALNEFDSSL